MLKMNLATGIAVLMLVGAGMAISSAQAGEVKYNFIEGRYALDVETDSNIDGDGLQLGGSFRINPDIYAFARYDTYDMDFNNDIDIFRIGAGYILPLNQNWDANFSLAFVNQEVNSDDDNGFALAAGVRGMLTPQLEGRASLTYIDVNDDDTYITLGADYFFQPNLSVGLEFDLSADLETTSIGLRYYF